MVTGEYMYFEVGNTLYSILYTVYCILYTVYCILYTVYCILYTVYCIPGNFSDVETLANLAINSFSLKLQVANLVLHCSPSTSTKVCTMENAKLAKIKRRNRLIYGKRESY